MSVYSVVKYGRKWAVCNSEDPNWIRHYDRKRDAIEAIPAFEGEDEHIARLFAMQESGVYDWTPEEGEQIDRLAEAIKTGESRPTFSGKQTVEAISRKEHSQDARTVEQWHALGPISGHGKRICVEIAWRRAARAEAFKRAGLIL